MPSLGDWGDFGGCSLRFNNLFGELRKASTEVADTLGKRLDAGHEWLYRHLERLFEKIDLQFGSPHDRDESVSQRRNLRHPFPG